MVEWRVRPRSSNQNPSHQRIRKKKHLTILTPQPIGCGSQGPAPEPSFLRSEDPTHRGITKTYRGLFLRWNSISGCLSSSFIPSILVFSAFSGEHSEMAGDAFGLHRPELLLPPRRTARRRPDHRWNPAGASAVCGGCLHDVQEYVDACVLVNVQAGEHANKKPGDLVLKMVVGEQDRRIFYPRQTMGLAYTPTVVFKGQYAIHDVFGTFV